MAKKCKKRKYTKPLAMRTSKTLTEKYGSEMMAYKCKKCPRGIWHVANKPDTLHYWQWLERKKEKRII
jgi:hypothetical protein